MTTLHGPRSGTGKGAQPEQGKSLAAWSGGYLAAAAVLLVLALVSIVAIDWLAAGVSGDVLMHRVSWWGAHEESYWSDAVASAHGLRLTSRDLLIKISGDSLTAQYTVTAPAGSVLATRVSASEDGNSGDDLVNNVLGAVRVAEFQYGFTGSHHSFNSLTFRAPQVSVTGRTAHVTVGSDPVRLYFTRQYISVDKPSGATVGGSDQIHINATSVQVMDVSGAAALDDRIDKTGVIVAANLSRRGETMTAAVSEGVSEHTWLDGLRGTGGITIPVADALLGRLAGLFFYVALLWALDGAAEVRDWSPEVARAVSVARKAVLTVVTGLALVAIIGFAFDLSTALLRDPDGQGYVAAGPLGLLVGGAALAWPLACSRVGSVGQPQDARRRLSWKAALPAALAYAAVVCSYWLALYLVLNVDPLTNVHVLTGTAAVTALVPVLLFRLVGRRGVMTWLVSAAMVAAALAATIAWPVLWYSDFFTSAPPPSSPLMYLDVNPKGKWIYLTVAVLAVAGLCIMSSQVVGALMGQDRRWRPAVAAMISVGIAVMILPDAVAKAQLANPHAVGSVPGDLFGLFDASPQLLDWLLLGLAITVVMLLPAQHDLRPVRRIAIPIALVLLYWNDTWLYLPVTFLIGLLLVAWLVLPKELTQAPPLPCTAEEALGKALSGWRGADFAAGQRQALAASGTDAPRNFEELANAQEKLAEEQDSRQRDARAAKARAFSHKGAMPDKETAKYGAIAGAVLGIIPAAVTVITSQPPSDSGGYPVLDFLGGTAWNLFFWAALGWFIGYFLPLIRGSNGTEKALWLFAVGVAASVPMRVIWNDGHSWTLDMIGYLELFIFLMVTTVILCDLCTLKKAGMSPTDWVRVQNWRFVVTWSTALIAAIGTATVAFLSTVATDITNQALNSNTSQQQTSQSVKQTGG
jgi:hypothetical protein